MSDIMIDNNLYDECRTYPNCTVEILRNSVTGKESVGWWRNDKPPIGKKKRKMRIVTVKSERDKPSAPVRCYQLYSTPCGEKLRITEECAVCSAYVDSLFSFCPSCGQKLDWENAEARR